MWEKKGVKGKHHKKGKDDPQLELKSTTTKKIDLTIEEAIAGYKRRASIFVCLVKNRGK